MNDGGYPRVRKKATTADRTLEAPIAKRAGIEIHPPAIA
jgi:hypothetical protein